MQSFSWPVLTTKPEQLGDRTHNKTTETKYNQSSPKYITKHTQKKPRRDRGQTVLGFIAMQDIHPVNISGQFYSSQDQDGVIYKA